MLVMNSLTNSFFVSEVTHDYDYGVGALATALVLRTVYLKVNLKKDALAWK